MMHLIRAQFVHHDRVRERFRDRLQTEGLMRIALNQGEEERDGGAPSCGVGRPPCTPTRPSALKGIVRGDGKRRATWIGSRQLGDISGDLESVQDTESRPDLAVVECATMLEDAG
jgi:hypothetical protein